MQTAGVGAMTDGRPSVASILTCLAVTGVRSGRTESPTGPNPHHN